MTRTADRAVADGIQLLGNLEQIDPPTARWCRMLNDTVLDFFATMPIIVADNVATYLRNGGIREFTLEDIPCLTPPWPNFWIESQRVTPGSRQRSAFWMQGHDLRDGEVRDTLDWVGKATADAVANGFDADALRFALLLVNYVEDRKRVIGPLAAVTLVLDEYGRCKGNHYIWLGPEEDPEIILISAATALQTISFMHCKNVVTDVVRPEPKLSRAHRRRHGHDLVDYRTVRLVVPRRTSGPSPTGSGLGDRPMHIATGHYGHYGNCCPGPDGHPPKGLLFGKLEGRYWIPTHLRGNPQYGQTRRDYNVTVNNES